MRPSQSKKLRNELRTEANQLLTTIMQKMHKKTINKYHDMITYNDNINTLRKAIRELNLFIDSHNRNIEQTKPLTSRNLKTIRQENKQIESHIQKMRDSVRERRKYETRALGGTFKESYIFADEIDGLAELRLDKLTEGNNILSNLLSFKLINELKRAKSNTHKVSLRSFIVIKCLLYKKEEDKSRLIKYRYREFFFNSPIRNIVSENNVKVFINDVLHGFLDALEEAKNGSEWIFDKFIKFTISSNVYKSVLGRLYIPLPESIESKKACVNIKNDDDKCFDWCLLASKYFDITTCKNKNTTKAYEKYWDSINRPKNVEYPITTDQISAYEELNNIQINVFELINTDEEITKHNIHDIYKSNQHRKEVVNLLLIKDGKKSHYVLIRNLSRLFTSKTTQHVKYFCPHCLDKSFGTADLLEKHTITCANYSESEKKSCDVVCECPEDGKNIMKFKNEGNSFKHPFHIVADFESTLVPFEDVNETSTKKYQKHLQNSFGLKYCCIHDKFDKDVELFNSADPEEVCKQFIEKVESYAMDSYNLLQLNKNINKIVYAGNQYNEHLAARVCHHCKNEFTVDNKKVAHHDHITGSFISSSCSKCNLTFKYKKFLPVYIHNLKGYDAHLFINALHKYGQTEQDVSCIPNNEERYISFSKNIKVGEYYCKKDKCAKPITFEIRFLDTIAFMNSSIESLVDNLREVCNTSDKLRLAFPNTSKHFVNDEHLTLMTQKGVYPYDFIDSFDKLNTSCLPPRDAFYSKLYDGECSESDYKQAKTVWDAFECKRFLDYHNLYLKSDVLLLADVWESFRNTCYNNYELDCTYYYTAPGLSFDAMLKFTKIELELFTDINMYEFCEAGIRGGLSQISTRHAVANNKYMSAYNPKIGDSYILYLDANNLYGWAMSRHMPVKDFKWNTDIWTREKIMMIPDDAEKGYKFKVDLHIPEHLHDKFNNYVPCPENVQVKKSDLNQWQQEEYKESKIRKLCCSFKDKIDYVIDYRYLKLVLSLGVELISVKQALEYTQTDFLKQYIELNTNLRKKANNDFEKDFFKLMNNSVFGKTMENVRARINFRLVSTDDQAWRVKNLNRFTIFSDTLVGVHIQKKEIKLNKPVYLGQTILDESKYLMYNFHYNFMLEKIPREDIDLLFTDTDSLCYNVRKHDVFQLMKDNKDFFDLSEYPENHELYDPTNKKVIGKFKNESVVPITEFIGLRAKLYSFTVDMDSKKHIKCKGVKTSVAKKQLNINMYRDVLFGRNTKSVSQNGIRSYSHQLYTETITKTALSARDDKVYICDDNVNTRNFGHYLNK